MKSGTPNKYPGGVFVWQKQKSDILCKCGCGEFITNRSARNLEQGKPNAGYIHGHIWKGKELPQHIKDKMNANRRDNKGEKNPNYGKGLFGADNPNWQGGKLYYIKKAIILELTRRVILLFVNGLGSETASVFFAER